MIRNRKYWIIFLGIALILQAGVLRADEEKQNDGSKDSIGILTSIGETPKAASDKMEGMLSKKEEGPAADQDSEDLKKRDELLMLRPGDRVLIKIYPEDEYIKGGEMDVSSEGNITFSLAGKVNVAGKTIPQAEKEIAQILDKDYLVNPEVVIELKETKKESSTESFVILGEVKKPGTYPMSVGREKFTLLHAVSVAGGFTDIANYKKVKVIRKVNGEKQVQSVNVEEIFNGNSPDLEIKNGDVIQIPESLF